MLSPPLSFSPPCFSVSFLPSSCLKLSIISPRFFFTLFPPAHSLLRLSPHVCSSLSHPPPHFLLSHLVIFSLSPPSPPFLSSPPLSSHTHRFPPRRRAWVSAPTNSSTCSWFATRPACCWTIPSVKNGPSRIPKGRKGQCTMGPNNQEYRLQYWATQSSVRSFARTAHSFACSALLASLARSAALTRLLARSLR